jgi:hypothetical protein
VVPWLGVGGGYAARGEDAGVAAQIWGVPRAIINARSNFVGDVISTTTSLLVLPRATYTGDQKPEIGFAGEAGIELRRGALDAAIVYYVERMPFAELNGNTRTDQFSTVRLRLGFKLGR